MCRNKTKLYTYLCVTYTYACRNTVNTIKTSGRQFFRKTYLSLYSKGSRKSYVWDVSWRVNKDCNILTPGSSGYCSPSFSSCGASQPRTLRAQVSAGSGSHYFDLQQLTPNSDLQLTRASCSTGLYNCLTSTCFSERCICTHFNLSTVKVSPDILTGCTCYLHRCISYLTARSGRRSIC